MRPRPTRWFHRHLRLRRQARGADWEEGQFPAVAVQLPMFNERAVCREIIRRTCELQWPRKKLFVQVLDDSTDPETRDAVDGAALFFRNQGVQITVLRRENRQGYKAGALKEGLEALGHCDFVAIPTPFGNAITP